METALYERAHELLKAGCPESRDVLRYFGNSIVYGYNEPSHLSFLLYADRDRVSEERARGAANALIESVTRDEPALVGRLRYGLTPCSETAVVNAEEPMTAAHELLAHHLEQHEADCPAHRDEPGYLFITEVGAEIGWRPEDDHLLAWFCVDSSCASRDDEACCEKAMAALKTQLPDLPPLRWQCTPYK